jgi:hypothetical protein
VSIKLITVVEWATLSTFWSIVSYLNFYPGLITTLLAEADSLRGLERMELTARGGYRAFATALTRSQRLGEGLPDDHPAEFDAENAVNA